MMETAYYVQEISGRHAWEVVAIETPMFMPGTRQGAMVALRGDLVKLAMLTGLLMGYLRDPCILVPVNQWKGQLPKKVVERRVKDVITAKLAKRMELRSHMWDAVGIGLYALYGKEWATCGQSNSSNVTSPFYLLRGGKT
jgi:hypothetical protein